MEFGFPMGVMVINEDIWEGCIAVGVVVGMVIVVKMVLSRGGLLMLCATDSLYHFRANVWWDLLLPLPGLLPCHYLLLKVRQVVA